MSYKVSEKEVKRSKSIGCQDEKIVANFLAELPQVLASLESIAEKKDFHKLSE
ncbi:hypothetical protein [Okeania sp.]|uniref:hypothetical protein n=1 Tax=Okeania sp. TaxID=3100323 RepID=UPI002B4B9162|nr:hypothetical protein [Okeania sp.]MEB3342371.1 hypothetical protein [Okeania sp.]